MRAYYVAETLSENLHKTPEGFLLCKNVPIARTGWQDYRASELGLGAEDGYNGSEMVKVYRDEAEVFSPYTIASFEGKSITSPHPPSFLNPSNYAGYELGQLNNIRKGPTLPDGERALLADLLIKNDRLIQSVESGRLRQVSCGYDCKYAAMGDHQYSQTEIVGNHLAVVENGRAGSNVRILDSKGEEEQPMETEVNEMPVGKFMGFLKAMGWKAPTADSSDPLKTAEEKTEKGEERKVARNADEDKEKEAKDAEEKKAANDRLTRIEDSVGKLVKHALDAEEEKKKEKEAEDKRVKDAKDAEEKEEKETKDAKCDCGAKGEETHDADCPMMDKKTKDAELIPVETLAPEDRPKNPIPGAAKAKDALMAIKPLIARRGTTDEKKAWNRAYTALTDATTDSKTEDAEYGEILKGKRPEGTGTNDEKNTKQQGADFQKTAAQFHRKNPGQVEIKREEKK